MISHPLETATTMADVQTMFGERFILACGGAMNNNQMNRSHALSGIKEMDDDADSEPLLR